MSKKKLRTSDADDVPVDRAGRLTDADPAPLRAVDGASGPPSPRWSHRARPVIEGIRPQVEAGAFPAKCTRGDRVTVEADAFADGHDLLFCELRYRAPGEDEWSTVPMTPIGDDRWRSSFPVEVLGIHRFMVRASVDTLATWRRDLGAKCLAGQDVTVDLAVGSALLTEASARATGADRRLLENIAGRLASVAQPPPEGSGPVDPPHGSAGLTDEIALLVDDAGVAAAVRSGAPGEAVTLSPVLTVLSDPEHARFATWYELFPRSASPDGDRPGTLADVAGRLDYLDGLGVDVLYLPPIHPIGRTNRKGAGGAAVAGPGDPGSPWAIGSDAGGHQAIHPELGTMADFDALVDAAGSRGIRIALDLAFQCSPDHPWVLQHPTWFRHLPDGSVRFAENPPKRYEDIYPIDFGTGDWQDLWRALADVVRFWIGHGVTVFRVDNPHTKPFGFWHWLIATVKGECPEAVFLAEAFTRPRVMERLAKVGFTESYTYFTWRTTAWELEQYLNELVHTERSDYFRPCLWPTTPDILPLELQTGATSSFVTRLVLAATLSASYGVYGPAFELGEHRAAAPGSEEYADSEKYTVRHWAWDRQDSLAGLVARINAIRRQCVALQYNHTLVFHAVDNAELIAYSKSAPTWSTGGGPATAPGGRTEAVLVVVNLDPTNVQGGWVSLELEALGLEPDSPFEVHDLLTDARYRWQGARNFVLLDPEAVSAHIFEVRRADHPTAQAAP